MDLEHSAILLPQLSDVAITDMHYHAWCFLKYTFCLIIVKMQKFLDQVFLLIYRIYGTEADGV